MRIFGLFFLFSLSLPAADWTVSGRVLDPDDAAVAYAQVSLKHRDGTSIASTKADESGEYRFAGIGAGVYWIEARGGELRMAEARRVELGAAPVRLDLRLGLGTLRGQVTVTASGTSQLEGDLAKAFTVIGGEEMERRQEFAVTEALRTSPGVRVQQLGGPGSLTRVHMRGLRAFDTSVLIDGFRLRDVSAPQGDATGFLGELLVVNTERIEVLRGSGSSLYGTNAIGGVANLLTDQGGGPAHGEVSAEGGGLGFFRGTARLAGGAWGDRLVYSAGLGHLNVMSGLDGDDRVRNTSGQGFAQLRLAPRTRLSGRVFGSGAFTGLNLSPSVPAGAAIPPTGIVEAREGRNFTAQVNDPDSRRTSRFLAGLITLTHQVTPGVSVRGHYHALSTERDNRNGPAGPGFQPAFANSNLFDSRIDTASGRMDAAIGQKQFVTAGYEFERESYENLARDENPNPASQLNAFTGIRQMSHAVYGQHQTQLLGDRLRVAASGRVQRFDLRRPAFGGGAPRYDQVALESPPNAYTGDLSAAYFVPAGGTKLRAHFGNAYRAPALYERFGTAFFGGNFTPYGDPRLAPERSLAVDAGFDQYLASNRVRISGTWFYTRLREVIGFDFSGLIRPSADPFGRSSGYRNTGGGLARGVEMSVEANPARGTRVFASYTYTNADEKTPAIPGIVRSIRVSDHMGTATVSRTLFRRLEVTGDLFAASSYLFPLFAGTGSRAYRFAGPVKADAALSYTIPLSERRRLQFYARVDNFLNRTYYEDGWRNPKAWAIGGLRVFY
jgi:iron complex outermembrane receptor protein